MATCGSGTSLVQMVDAVGVEERGAALDAMHFVALTDQEFGQIRAVLAGNAGDQAFFISSFGVRGLCGKMVGGGSTLNGMLRG